MKKLIAIFFTIVCLFSCFAGCGNGKDSSGESSSGGGDSSSVDTRPIVSKAKNIFYGDDNGERLSNPLMGWSYYGFPEEIIKYGIPDEFDVGIIHCSWDQLEPKRGQFDFDLLTRAINRLKNDGKTVYLRLYLMPDNVWNIAGYPEWVKYVPGVGEFTLTHTPVNGGEFTFYAPDYSSKVYQDLMENFLYKLCREYDDGLIDVIDARCYCLYGEWDSGWGNPWFDPQDEETIAHKTKVLNELVNVYARAFEDYDITKVAINVPSIQRYNEADMLAYEKQCAYDTAMEEGFVLRFDAIENQYYPYYFFEWLRKKNPGVPIFSESCYGLDPQKTNIVTSYISFCTARVNVATFGFYKGNYERIYNESYDFYEETMKPSERFDYNVIGYRIRPTKITFSKEANVGGKIEFESSWVNTGSGLLYRDYPLCLSLVDADGKEVYVAYRDDFDITTLMKEDGEYRYSTKFNLPSADKLPAGEYTVRVSLVDKNNNNKSAIAMPLGENANANRDYVIGKITLK